MQVDDDDEIGEGASKSSKEKKNASQSPNEKNNVMVT